MSEQPAEEKQPCPLCGEQPSGKHCTSSTCSWWICRACAIHYNQTNHAPMTYPPKEQTSG